MIFDTAGVVFFKEEDFRYLIQISLSWKNKSKKDQVLYEVQFYSKYILIFAQIRLAQNRELLYYVVESFALQ